MSAISQAVERLTLIAKRGGGFSSTMTGKLDAEAATIVHARLAELEAKQPRAAALERECAAARAVDDTDTNPDASHEDWLVCRTSYRFARAATDATEGK